MSNAMLEVVQVIVSKLAGFAILALMVAGFVKGLQYLYRRATK
jgi:hypothetical protein